MEAIEAELTGPVSAYFSEIRPEPLASGSVAQTHRARLLNGKDVIIKIQRPNLPEIIEEDLTLLIRLSRRIPKAIPSNGRLTRGFAANQRKLDT